MPIPPQGYTEDWDTETEEWNGLAEDWGNSFDDNDGIYWEDFLGGPDDDQIEQAELRLVENYYDSDY